MTDVWISNETELKEQHYAGIVQMHLTICRSILGRRGGPPYLYADLHAGPGWLEYAGRRFRGSPLIFMEAARKADIRYEALCFDSDESVADRLADAMRQDNHSDKLFDVEDDGAIRVVPRNCERGMAGWLRGQGHQPGRHGLVYADPIGTEMPSGLLADIARALPRVDILSYVSASNYKRRRGQNAARATLAEHIAAVGKKYALIREPYGKHQWTFVLFTNWDGFPEWKQIGLHRVDSEKGQRVLDLLNLTSRELHEATNTPLFQLPRRGDAPYRGYREYLRHPRFREIRGEVFKWAAGLCERCMDRTPTEPHHLRYPPWGTFDVPENMIAVCHGCHCEIHGKAS